MTLQPARLLMLLVAAVALPAMAQNLAVVNGKPVPSSRADAFIQQMAAQGQPDSPQLREMVKEELINREILIQEADKRGISNTTEVKNQVEMARQSIAIRALVQDYLKKNPISDADLKAEYDKAKAKAANEKEYLARHILVEKEDDAKAIITKLKGGAKFEDLAKQSKDPGSASNGGSLDWAPPGGYVKPFADAMVALQKGQMTDTPVKTQFGYHVIKVEDIRQSKFPAFDDVKPQIAESLQQQKLQSFQTALRKKAKIQ
ncbi:MAG TPA: peptidylprolyl isomerase [Noviherbaspirillum sp.]|nr:peptidylprolyl isomerase [Noviherbaspirillum sp.]